MDRLHGTFVDGPPDLVIEISSPGSRGLDRGEKFFEYAEAGVAEYWLIDPERKRVEAYRRGGEGGAYDPVPLGEPPVLRSEALPGMGIAVEWLWAEPLPKQAWVREQWGLA
jgi:Uma2 family endonuclease